MRFETGDLLEYVGRGPVVITTNGTVRKNGKANLGSGNAKQMGEAHQWLDAKLGYLIDQFGNHVHYLDDNIISFPVEHSWQEYADINLVRRSALELVQMADQSGWTEIFMPLPGCGKGGLRPVDVIAVLSPILDSRFVVLNKE